MVAIENFRLSSYVFVIFVVFSTTNDVHLTTGNNASRKSGAVSFLGPLSLSQLSLIMLLSLE